VLSFSLSVLPLAFGAARRVDTAFCCCAFGVPLVRTDAAEGVPRTEAADPGRRVAVIEGLTGGFCCVDVRPVTGGDGSGGISGHVLPGA